MIINISQIKNPSIYGNTGINTGIKLPEIIDVSEQSEPNVNEQSVKNTDVWLNDCKSTYTQIIFLFTMRFD